MLITRSDIRDQYQRDKAAFDRIPPAMRDLLIYEMNAARRTEQHSKAPTQDDLEQPQAA